MEVDAERRVARLAVPAEDERHFRRPEQAWSPMTGETVGSLTRAGLAISDVRPDSGDFGTGLPKSSCCKVLHLLQAVANVPATRTTQADLSSDK
jgi:hypothetical protein